MRKYKVGLSVTGVAILFLMLWTHGWQPSNEPATVRVKSEIAGTRQIHQMIKTRTGEEEITYEDYYISKEFFKAAGENKARSARLGDDIPWVQRGPGNIGGRARAILVDASDASGDTWLIGTSGGGIWKTEDAGDTWRNVSPFFPNLSIVTLAQSDINPRVIYAGSGEGGLGGNFVNGIGIYKSLDSGENWTLLTSTTSAVSSDFQNTNRIIVHPDNENIVYAATSNGIRQSFASAVMKSEDGGSTWTSVFSPPGRAQQLQFDPESPNTLYVSVALFGVAKSTDAGATWTFTELSDVVNKSGGDTERTELAIAPTNPSILYASVSYRNRSGSGLFKSDDKGDNWQEVKDAEEADTDFLVQGEFDNCIVVDPLDENKVFWGGVRLYSAQLTGELDSLETRDFTGVDQEGTSSFLSFTRFSSGTHFNGSIALSDPANTSTIEIRFGAGSQLAHRFTVPEGGNAGVPDASYSYRDYVTVPFQAWDIENDQQLMLSFRDQEADGVFNLNEGGLDSDESRNREYLFVHRLPYDTAPSDTIAQTRGHVSFQDAFIWPTLTTGGVWDPNNLPTSTLRINFGRPLFRTADIELLPGNNQIHVDHHALAYSTDNRLISVNDGGLGFTQDDGETFTEKEQGMVTAQYYSVDRHPNRGIYIGGTQDNDVNLSLTEDPTSSTSYDDNAFRAFFADGFDVVWNDDGRRILASNQHNFMFRSDNEGRDWEESTTGLDDSDIFGENDNTPFFTKLAYSKFGPDRVFAVSDRGVWKSEDFGENWTLERISVGFGGFLDVEVSDVNVEIVWAGGALDQGRRIFLSQDGGETFDPVNFFEDFPSKGNITTIETDPNDERTAYLLFSQPGEPKILKTTDLGETWTDVSGFLDGTSTSGFPDVGVFSLLVFPDGERIWAATEIGLFETLNGGDNWALLQSDMPAVAIWDLNVVGGEVLAATHGLGIWTADMGLIYENIRTQRPLSIDQDISAFQIYPNPSPGTFRINGPRDMQRVEVWSLSGKLVGSFDGSFGANQTFTVSTDKGLHLVRVISADGVFTTKLIVE
ncbi:MAG: T9SS type A sorting domain-containing protein [Bacteroidota bacterium]